MEVWLLLTADLPFAELFLDGQAKISTVLNFFPFLFSFSSSASNVWIHVSIGGSPQLRSCPGRDCLSQRFYWPTQCCPTVLTIDLPSSLRKDLGMGFTAEVTELLNCN